ncbi:IS3 family transposase [Hominenteromicrobium sp.]|uniref:IS3 family transposase n=1 Tax=Hominenteromicrobium sp. TaxID=3073581 RepID=UPI003AB1BC1B
MHTNTLYQQCVNASGSVEAATDPEVSSKSDETELEIEIKTVFHESQDVCGSRKIKKELEKRGFQISRRRICRIMKRLGLVSVYTLAAFRPCKTKCSESSVKMN